MKKLLLSLLLLPVGCKESPPSYRGADIEFTEDLTELREFFHVPGIAAIVMNNNDSILYEHYFGYADLEKKIPVDPTTEFHMASLTKMFSGAALMNLVDNGDSLFLEEPIAKYVSDKSIPDSIKVKHIWSHTSQGEVGKHFYYSNRYSWLTQVIEKKYKKPFKSVIDSLIIDKLGLKHTYLLGDSIQLVNESRNLARPYMFDGETKPGFIDYGYSAAAGIASTVRDLAKFGKLIRKIPEREYNYGYFHHEIDAMDVLWAYGQYDCYSALFVKVPSREVTFVLAANNNLLSDPARLIYGDVLSLFALKFLEHFAIEDLRVPEVIDEEIQARAVAESFMAMYDANRIDTCKTLYRTLFPHPPYGHANLTNLHGLMTLKEIAARSGQPEFTEFDPPIKAIAKELLEADINNPYTNVYMGQFYSLKNSDSARVYYERIANAKNFSRWWYTIEAESWLKQHPKG